MIRSTKSRRWAPSYFADSGCLNCLPSPSLDPTTPWFYPTFASSAYPQVNSSATHALSSGHCLLFLLSCRTQRAYRWISSLIPDCLCFYPWTPEDVSLGRKESLGAFVMLLALFKRDLLPLHRRSHGRQLLFGCSQSSWLQPTSSRTVHLRPIFSRSE